MQKQMSVVERFLRVEGEEKGIENTIRSFIERKISRHVSEEDIFEELRLDFGLDIHAARHFMVPSLAKA